MEGSQHLDAPAAEGLRALTEHIPAGAHGLAVDGIDLAVPHGEIIGMLSDGAGVLRARAHHQVGPGLGVEAITRHHGNEVLVAEVMQVAVMLLVVAVLLQALAVHVAGIPLIHAGGHAVGPPVEEQAELGVPEPLRRAVPDVRPVDGLLAVHGRHFLSVQRNQVFPVMLDQSAVFIAGRRASRPGNSLAFWEGTPGCRPDLRRGLRRPCTRARGFTP